MASTLHITHKRTESYSRTFRASRSGVPVDLTGARIRLHIKAKATDNEAAAIYKFDTDAPASNITIIDSTDGTFTVGGPTIKPALAAAKYVYDVFILEADGTNLCWLTGTWEETQNVTP
jgi:hypothetical protein